MAVLPNRKLFQLCINRCNFFIGRTLTGSPLAGEVDRKGGYDHSPKIPLSEKIKEGFKIFRKDIKRFKQSIKDRASFKDVYFLDHGDYKYMWKFDGVDSLEDWVFSCDRDNLEGFSKAKLSLSKSNKALFQGYISQRVPKDGIIKRSGYATLRSPLKYKYFGKYEPYRWHQFTHIVLRVRGDGRPYKINLNIDREFNVQWFDMYSYTMFTRGGPYWQVVKIPFSKFFLNYKARIQDDQRPINLHFIRSLAITLADGAEGPFQLEIDYIGLLVDKSHTEEFAYELYKPTSNSALM